VLFSWSNRVICKSHALLGLSGTPHVMPHPLLAVVDKVMKFYWIRVWNTETQDSMHQAITTVHIVAAMIGWRRFGKERTVQT
jgi:hypothetical protein